VFSVRRNGAVAARPPEISRWRLERPGRSVILFSRLLKARPPAQAALTFRGHCSFMGTAVHGHCSSWALRPLTSATLLRAVAICARNVPIAARTNGHSRAQISAQISFTINEFGLSDLIGHLIRLIENLEKFAETHRSRRRAL
jgi:hypothetical protein